MYPLFLGPSDFFAKPPTTWTKSQGVEYFRWILEVKQSRTAQLLQFLGVKASRNALRFLLDVGREFQVRLKSREFTEPTHGGNRPNAQGSALAADVGLLLGDMLVNRHRDLLKWELYTKTKRDIDYNQPVVSGWPYSPSQNFIRFGIVQAYNISQGKGDIEMFAKQFYSLEMQANDNVVVLVTEGAESSTGYLERAYIRKDIPFRKIDWRDTLRQSLNETRIDSLAKDPKS